MVDYPWVKPFYKPFVHLIVMAREALSEIVSSPARLKIASLVSERPRGLAELAEATGISVQAVLKHLVKLKGLGIIEEQRVVERGLAVRKVYAAKGARLGDFSTGDLTLVKLSPIPPGGTVGAAGSHDLEYLAEEAIMQKRRVRDQARRLARMIDELFEDEARIEAALKAKELSEMERLILRVLYAEDTIEDGRLVLQKHFGLPDAQKSVDRAMAKANHRPQKRSR